MRLLVLPHARVHGWPKHNDAPHGQCPELGDALAAEYATDAHHTAYAPDPIAPRMSSTPKPGRSSRFS